ncbi:MAG: VWA domain-containing protein [Candidatus Zixiibacteriota bacterium]|nr:MAG: VWA domain-containing protein [candidate division Zixibacteria bacterium]
MANRFIVYILALLFLVSCAGYKPRYIEEPRLATPPAVVVPEGFNTENYNAIHENEFLNAASNPLSTFSIDVDAASYSNVRRFINDNRLPPIDAVRIEEMINYFSYDYPQPRGRHPFSVTTEVSECPWERSHKLIHIGLQGEEIPVDDLPPANLVFLLDVSGSMNSPDKLPLLKSAFKMLVKQLRREDRVAIVVYAGAAGLVLPSCDGNKKRKILRAIDRLQAGGTTAGAAGIRLAYRIAGENFVEYGNNRVILATDGDFNVGVSSDAELIRLIEKEREKGVYLTVLGFGTGNLKDSRMEQLADKGNGNYAFIDNKSEARKVLVSELGGTLFTIARDVKVQVEFNPVNVDAYRLIGYENRLLKKEDFSDDKKDAGEMGSGHSVTVLYEIIPAGVESRSARTESLKYQTTGINPEALKSDELMTIKFRYKLPDDNEIELFVKTVMDDDLPLRKSSENFRFSAAVTEFGMLLRDSKLKGRATYNQAIRLAESSLGRDKEGYREEFVELVESCALMAEDMTER